MTTWIPVFMTPLHSCPFQDLHKTWEQPAAVLPRCTTGLAEWQEAGQRDAAGETPATSSIPKCFGTPDHSWDDYLNS